MRTIIQSSQFKKDYKRVKKRGKDMEKLHAVIRMLAADVELPTVLHDHALSGNWSGFRDCHIEPDWLLIYKKEGNNQLELNELQLGRTGTHADLFKK